MTTLTLASFGDWMSLSEFATWLDVSPTVATETLMDLDIKHVRLGSRGQYRISTLAVALAFGVPLTYGSDDGMGPVSPNTDPPAVAVASTLAGSEAHETA